MASLRLASRVFITGQKSGTLLQSTPRPERESVRLFAPIGSGSWLVEEVAATQSEVMANQACLLTYDQSEESMSFGFL